MIYTPTQLEIIRLFGRKELSFGCIFKYGDCYTRYCHPGTSFHIVQKLNADTYAIGNEDFKKIELIGHIPHLEDVFRVAEDKNKIRKFEMNVDRSTLGVLGLRFYENIDGWSRNRVVKGYIPTLPILEQPEATIIELLTIFK